MSVARDDNEVRLVRSDRVVAVARIDRERRIGELIRTTDFSDAVDEGTGDPLENFLDKHEQEFRLTAAHTLACSFCGKTQQEVAKLIAGPGSYICNECISLCADIIAEDHVPTPPVT